MNNKNAETDADLLWRTMEDCPTGPKVLLLNKAGLALTGCWDGKDNWYVGWHPLPKIPLYIKELIEPTYRPQSRIGALIGD